jgi:hypothetical protein
MTNRGSTEALVVAPTLRATYEAAEYDVDARSARAVLRIGAPTPSILLDGALTWRRVAVITAWNPFSVPSSAEANAARQARLVRELERAGRSFLPALGRDPRGEWAPEPSFAVFEASGEQLDDWMLAFGQNAVVVADAGGRCELRCHPHECARLAAEGPSAERAAARLWANVWNTLELDLLEGALSEDVVYTSPRDGATRMGRAAVTEHLRGELRALHAAVTPGQQRARATVGTCGAGLLVRPCASMFAGGALEPTASAVFTLRRGSIARIDVSTRE